MWAAVSVVTTGPAVTTVSAATQNRQQTSHPAERARREPVMYTGGSSRLLSIISTVPAGHLSAHAAPRRLTPYGSELSRVATRRPCHLCCCCSGCLRMLNTAAVTSVSRLCRFGLGASGSHTAAAREAASYVVVCASDVAAAAATTTSRHGWRHQPCDAPSAER